MGHAKANAKLHDQNYGEDTFDDDEEEEDCQMLVSFLLGRHVSPSKESDWDQCSRIPCVYLVVQST